MYSRPIVKDDFEVPKELVTKNFILNPLTINHLNSEIQKIDKELQFIEKKKVFTVLRGDNNETMDD